MYIMAKSVKTIDISFLEEILTVTITKYSVSIIIFAGEARASGLLGVLQKHHPMSIHDSMGKLV
jgi:hypothetical protein